MLGFIFTFYFFFPPPMVLKLEVSASDGGKLQDNRECALKRPFPSQILERVHLHCKRYIPEKPENKPNSASFFFSFKSQISLTSAPQAAS